MIKCWKTFPYLLFLALVHFSSFFHHLLIFRVCCGAFVVGASPENSCLPAIQQIAVMHRWIVVEWLKEEHEETKLYRDDENSVIFRTQLFIFYENWTTSVIVFFFYLSFSFFFLAGLCARGRVFVIGLGFGWRKAWAPKSGFVRRLRCDVAARRKRFQ